jgi:hypothetical protein
VSDAATCIACDGAGVRAEVAVAGGGAVAIVHATGVPCEHGGRDVAHAWLAGDIPESMVHDAVDELARAVAVGRVPAEPVELEIDVDEAVLAIGAPSIGFTEIPNSGSIDTPGNEELAVWCRAFAKLLTSQGANVTAKVRR